ncbi:A disintegrin and metalloproteinase with thrombospondin motifs 16 isoform X1 [Dunckerocampus dactyliophorus]|uniref:A disintegrin and metalloproteinase with thrombospondin motifs 16 isoform X1 n=1 Tax=Dunckerocampus dactyliophorus TaxID=161453 RepID=UPI0024068450|nr:A disintegrin and metalloproteinase with thrombospondin motifs 16 isoform X1 [Dunckerocampus dactyliophorus]
MARLRTVFFFHLACSAALSQGLLLNVGSANVESPGTSAILHSLGLPQHTEYELVSPYEVDHQGVYVSHEITHHQRKRRRRSLSPDASSSNADGGSEMTYFRVSGLGQDFHMELKETSESLIAPGFTIQVLGNNGTKSLRAYHQDDLCFYQGSLRLRVNSSVALSTCTGMTGLIRTQDADYFLRPVSRQVAHGENFTAPSSHQPHILYKSNRDTQAGDRGHHPRGLQKRSPDSAPHKSERSLATKSQTDSQADEEDLQRNQQSEPPGNHDKRDDQQEHHAGSNYHNSHWQDDDYTHKDRQRQHFCGRRKKYMPKPPTEDLFLLPDEYKFIPRNKRAVFMKNQSNQKLNVETLVVVDRKMMDNHGHENITTYVLTVLNMVSSLFKDGTIGGSINIVIVGLVLLDEEQDGLVISHHADHTLNSFCQWQSTLGGREGQRHDHAILLTGFDICSWKNEPCDTLGFAPISGMCSKYRSCTINEDTGLGLAFTIAHESGHNFGMVHDGEGNICKKSEGNIMSPTLAGHNGIFSWSACSRQYLSRFLNSAQALCLSDEPQGVKEYRYPEKLPGELYDADTQCKWQFGEKAKLCTLDFKKDICKALWCHRVGRKCETKFMPAAEGSACGPDMWCRRGQCVKQGDEGPRPQHGQWSEWSSWSVCSRSCESGVTYRERHCNNPRPAYGGKFCEGSTRSYKLCNTQDCPLNAIDYRTQQCAEFNSKQFRGWHYTWRPYTRVDDQDICKLYCFAEGYDFFFALASKVKDGTLCSRDSSNVCIDGLCERVGCDRVLGSTAGLDVCGVCKGDNSTCKTYKGQYTKQHHSNQYYGVVIIPAGARSIRVLELNTSSSYLAVRDTQRRYFLNGHWTVDWPGRHPIAGAIFEYKRPYNRPESLISVGPTNETLVIEILLQGLNPGVLWEYTLNKADEGRNQIKHNYTWAVIRSKCSASCAGGHMNTKPACYKDMRFQVNTSYCNARSRPATGVIPCNIQPCPASWSVGEWGACSQSCGGGEQTRQVHCVQRSSQTKEDTTADSHCSQPAPARRQACSTRSCPPVWKLGPWSQCSRKCGNGLRKRTVLCTRPNTDTQSQTLADSLCAGLPKPASQESCFIKRCQKQRKVQWFVSTWQECSVTCGGGYQARFIKCAEKDTAGKYRELAAKKCHHIPRPIVELQRHCILVECPVRTTPSVQRWNVHHYTRAPLPRPEWHASPWSQCTVTCGGGVQARMVQCLVQGKPFSGCAHHLKPSMSQACNTNFCPQPDKKDLACRDYFNWCYLVPQHGVCNHKFYGKQCCQSCSRSNL